MEEMKSNKEEGYDPSLYFVQNTLIQNKTFVTPYKNDLPVNYGNNSFYSIFCCIY